MQLVYQSGAWLVGFALQLMLIAALVRGEYRRYPFVFLFVIVDFLTSVIEVRPSIAFASLPLEQQRMYAKLYWWDERIIQAVVFLMVISLVYKAAAQWRPRRLLLLGIIFGTLTFASISLLVHYSPALPPGKWMTPWTRDLNFCAAILDLVLWALLLAAPKPDYRLLMVSGAFGIQFTGGAIGQALLSMSTTYAAYFIPVVNLACLYICWQAFRPAPKNSGTKGRRSKTEETPLTHPVPK